MQIRDESHRFGITFHRKLRNKKSISSILNEIPGVGEFKRQRLLTHFGSLKRLKTASAKEIADVEGFGPRLAQIVHAFLKDKN